MSMPPLWAIAMLGILRRRGGDPRGQTPVRRCGGEDSPARHPTTCRDAACAEKDAWDHARQAHPDDIAVIEVQGDA